MVPIRPLLRKCRNCPAARRMDRPEKTRSPRRRRRWRSGSRPPRNSAIPSLNLRDGACCLHNKGDSDTSWRRKLLTRRPPRRPPHRRPPRGVDPTEALAGDVLRALLHRVLVRLGEPARVPRSSARSVMTPSRPRWPGTRWRATRASLSRWTAAGTSPSATWTPSGPRSGHWKSWSATTALRCPSPALPGNWPTSTSVPVSISTRSRRACCAAPRSSPSPTAWPTACAPGFWTSARTASGTSCSTII